MHSDSVFSPPRYYKSFTCPNKVSLLFGLNSKLVPHSRGASPDQILAAFQVKNNRTKKVSSTTPWQGEFTVICKSTWRKTRIYPRPTLQGWPSFVPAHGSLINQSIHSTQTKSSKWWPQTLFSKSTSRLLRSFLRLCGHLHHHHQHQH